MCHVASGSDILELNNQTDLSLSHFLIYPLNTSRNWALPGFMVLVFPLKFMSYVYDRAALVCGIAVIIWLFEADGISSLNCAKKLLTNGF